MSSKRQGSQGGKAAASRQAGERAAVRASARRRLAMLVLGVVLIASVVLVAVAQGIGDPSLGDGEIAVVEGAPDGTITSEDLDRAVQQVAAQQQIRKVPKPEDPQYDVLVEGAVNTLIAERWVLGEAEDRGLEVSEREITERLDTIKKQNFKSEQEFQSFLDRLGFSVEDARRQIMLGLLDERLSQAVNPEAPDVSSREIEDYYEANAEQFQVPEQRDVRVITTKTEAEAAKARSRLEADDSVKSFEDVAQRFSTDEATKSTGGLRQGVVEGQSEEAIETQIFGAPEGELVGPFPTESGFGLLRVEKITEARTTPLDEAREQITTTLQQARQQELGATFQEDFATKWISRTFCAEDYRIDRCANADPPPDACTTELAETQGCDAPVASTRPIPPGGAAVLGQPAPVGLPQGPITTQPAAQPGFVPGVTPLPPGVAPPGAAPPGAAPPAAPPGAPPPAPPPAPPGG